MLSYTARGLLAPGHYRRGDMAKDLILMDEENTGCNWRLLNEALDDTEDAKVLAQGECGLGFVDVRLVELAQDVPVKPVSRVEALRVCNNWYDSDDPFLTQLANAIRVANAERIMVIKAAFIDAWERYDYEPDENGRPIADGAV